jgi:uncharacterized Zn-binding protein involved in type VI secretion
MANQPAAKKGDFITATDTHVVLVPSAGGIVSRSLPHPFKGELVGELSSNVFVMGQPAAMVGSVANNSPRHTPTPPGTSFQRPPANRGVVADGSKTVKINGRPAARQGDAANTCNDPVDRPVGKVVVNPGTTVFID